MGSGRSLVRVFELDVPQAHSAMSNKPERHNVFPSFQGNNPGEYTDVVRTLLQLSSAATPELYHRKTCSMCAPSGIIVLDKLEATLKSSSLAAASPEKLTTLFVIVMDTVLAVIYSRSCVNSALVGF